MSTRPTREQIENANPDELNMWVAEMMGWKTTPIGVGLPPDWKERRPRAKWVGQTDMRKIPKFSTDIAAAIPLAERYRMSLIYCAGGCYAIIPESGEQSFVRGTDVPTYVIYGREQEEFAFEPTLSLAICRAALLWWVEQPTEIQS